MWSAFQARDWAAARRLLRDDLQAVWWTSGERFDGADAFIAAQARYPEGWTIHAASRLERLEDGRVMSLVRVDHAPQQLLRDFVLPRRRRADRRHRRVLGDGRAAAGLAQHRHVAGLRAFDPTGRPAGMHAVTVPAHLPPADQALVDAIIGAPGRRSAARWPRPSRCWNRPAPTTARAPTRCSTRCCRTAAARFRLGISGVPGVGKSTFIEALGLFLIAARPPRGGAGGGPVVQRVSGGSILGDKTRMERLSVDERAYIRPSPASGTLGGVAEKTREAMLVCEAAGHDIVIVETVGVGQSETAVAGMTDMFVLLQLPNAGDDLQAIKKGVMELADLVVINKADLDEAAATRARAQITSALRLFGLHGTPDARAATTHALARRR